MTSPATITWLQAARTDLLQAFLSAQSDYELDQVLDPLSVWHHVEDALRHVTDALMIANAPAPEPPPEQCPGDDPKNLAQEVTQ